MKSKIKQHKGKLIAGLVIAVVSAAGATGLAFNLELFNFNTAVSHDSRDHSVAYHIEGDTVVHEGDTNVWESSNESESGSSTSGSSTGELPATTDDATPTVIPTTKAQPSATVAVPSAQREIDLSTRSPASQDSPPIRSATATPEPTSVPTVQLPSTPTPAPPTPKATLVPSQSPPVLTSSAITPTVNSNIEDQSASPTEIAVASAPLTVTTTTTTSNPGATASPKSTIEATAQPLPSPSPTATASPSAPSTPTVTLPIVPTQKAGTELGPLSLLDPIWDPERSNPLAPGTTDPPFKRWKGAIQGTVEIGGEQFYISMTSSGEMRMGLTIFTPQSVADTPEEYRRTAYRLADDIDCDAYPGMLPELEAVMRNRITVDGGVGIEVEWRVDDGQTVCFAGDYVQWELEARPSVDYFIVEALFSEIDAEVER